MVGTLVTGALCVFRHINCGYIFWCRVTLSHLRPAGGSAAGEELPVREIVFVRFNIRLWDCVCWVQHSPVGLSSKLKHLLVGLLYCLWNSFIRFSTRRCYDYVD